MKPMLPIARYRLLRLLLSILVVGVAAATMVYAQDAPQGRKIIHRTMPVYPALARQLNLAGTVKVIAVVAPDGKVKTVEPVGGSPILIEAAKEAIVRWKFASAAAESREVIELHFNP